MDHRCRCADRAGRRRSPLPLSRASHRRDVGIVTLVRVQEYREEQAKAAAANEALTASAAPPATAGPPPLTNAPPTPPVALPLMAPTVRGPTGGAAPPAAENPYAGSTR